ncbi:putative quinol monooxygenase [Brumicola pallidula]|jgi:quinol monooxygenase YgiN|uniref:Antibiotic biosynthesis monooxygenase domain protein n=1 Tax=Brumicola pallidula DSM 14239 = ACAM 615 TaxID=1121922 RepID=K6ZAU7_9ALTE|nr:putative quinol monooxygenase [Glaciecola pallidula]GAC27487.1 antibiotic biosynthesis monooxygenase domain protein [Glaciecola pallidula DSM 14239 = ACAM 615]
MLVISARIELAPKDVDAYIAAAQKIITATHAETGCYLYAIAVDINLANVIWITEQWESESDLMAHLNMPHIVEFLAFCGTVEVIDMNIIKYDVSAAGPLVLPES